MDAALIEGTAQPQTVARSRVLSFLLADIRGYTRYTVENGDEAAARLAAAFSRLAAEIAPLFDGRLVEVRGDEVLLSFDSARQAVRASVALQIRALDGTPDQEGLNVGIGLDAGEAVAVDDGFRGAALNRAARLCSLAGPGEILASDGIVHLAGTLSELAFADRGSAQLKGFPEPVRVVEVRPKREEGPVTGGIVSGPEIQTHLPIGGYLGSLPEGDLIAREVELGQATNAVDSASSGSGRTIFLVGEPGVGKTRLAQEITRIVRNREFVIAAGACYESTQTVPFAPMLEIFGALESSAPPAVRERISTEWRNLDKLLPSRAIDDSRAPLDPEEEQRRLFWSAGEFVAALAEERPIAILVDDLHWADGSTLDLIQFLARRTRALAVLILGTYRDVEVNRAHPLEAALRDLSRQHVMERIQLRRLDREATAALVHATAGHREISDEVISQIFDRTEGNPFFAEEVAKTLSEDRPRPDAEANVPESIRSLIGQRLSHLSEVAQDVLQRAAALGLVFQFEDLLAMNGYTEAQLEECMGEATQAGMVKELPGRGGEKYGFNHALTQQAIYAEIPIRRRRRLHLTAGNAIAEISTPASPRLAELAHHFLEADDVPKALGYSLDAGRAAETALAYREARSHFKVAAELAEELEDSEALARAQEGLGNAEVALGKFDEGIAVSEAAVEGYERRKDRDGVMRGLANIARAHYWLGTTKHGLARLDPVARDIDLEEASPDAVQFLIAYASLLYMAGREVDMKSVMDRVLTLVEAGQDERLTGQVLGRLGLAELAIGNNERAVEVLERSQDIAERHADTETLLRALTNVSFVYLARGELDRGMEAQKRSRELSANLGTTGGISQSLVSEGILQHIQGNWTESRRLYAEAEASCGGGSWTRWVWESKPQIAMMDYYQNGDRARAVRHLEELAQTGSDIGHVALQRIAVAWLVWIDLEQGDGAKAESRLQSVPSNGFVLNDPNVPFLAIAYAKQGRAEEALRLLDKDVPSPAPSPIGAAAFMARGHVYESLGRLDDAENAFRAACELTEPVIGAFYVGHYREWLGLVLRKQGRESEARTELEEARRLFEIVEAPACIQRVTHHLAVA